MKENTLVMVDINFKNITDNLSSHGVQIAQSVKDMIDAYGNAQNPLKIKGFIRTVYTFINDVLSGYYDTMNLGLEIFDSMLKLAAGEDVNNSYIRSISYGG